MKRSISRTLLERKTPEEIAAEHGEDGLLTAFLKSLLPHDADRNIRNQEREEKALARKEKRRKWFRSDEEELDE